METPGSIHWLRDTPGGRGWLASLPGTVRRCCVRWDLTVGAPFGAGNVSWVAPASRRGRPCVLKVQWPHPESEHEAAALARWNGDGAVRLLGWEPEDHALLLERCDPGAHLGVLPAGRAIGVLGELLPRLSHPMDDPAPFTTLEVQARRWSAALANRPGTDGAGRLSEFVAVAIQLLDRLGPTQGDQVLVHQDLHGDNVLSAGPRGWLAIDPKPLVGEREFSISGAVRSFEFGHTRSAVISRLDRLCDELGLDRERARAWAIAQSVAWFEGSRFAHRHLETVGWLLDEGGQPALG